MAKFNMKGWNLKEFLRGRKRLLFAAVGFIGTQLVTQDATLSGIVAAATEMIGALVEYYISQ